MTYEIDVYTIKELGHRKNQEDCIFPSAPYNNYSERTFILCDGMGGHDLGEVASSAVCEAMDNSISSRDGKSANKFSDGDLHRAVSDAYDALDGKDNGSEKKMGTTMTFLQLHSEGVTIAHIGDSRVYHIRPGKDGSSTKILHVTHDHSLKNDLIKAGILESEDDIQNFKQKNVITKAMQPKMEHRSSPDIYHTIDILPGDYFYLCSDGMLEASDMENGESIKNIFSDKIPSPQRKVEILRQVTAENRDNHSAVIVHVKDVGDNSVNKSNNAKIWFVMAIAALISVLIALLIKTD